MFGRIRYRLALFTNHNVRKNFSNINNRIDKEHGVFVKPIERLLKIAEINVENDA